MMQPDKADTVAQVCLLSAQFRGWDGQQIEKLRTVSLYAEEVAPDWYEVTSNAQKWINEHVHFVVNNGRDQKALLRPIQIVGIPDAEEAPEEFRVDGKLPEGTIDADCRGIQHAVGFHEMPQAKEGEGAFTFVAPEPITGKPLNQQLFEAILALGKDWLAWPMWTMFVKVIDDDVTDYKRYWALRSTWWQTRRRLTSPEGKHLADLIDTYRRSLPIPKDEWDKS